MWDWDWEFHANMMGQKLAICPNMSSKLAAVCAAVRRAFSGTGSASFTTRGRDALSTPFFCQHHWRGARVGDAMMLGQRNWGEARALVWAMQEHALFWCSSVADPAQAVFLNEGWPNPSGAGNSLGSKGGPGAWLNSQENKMAGVLHYRIWPAEGRNNCGQSSRVRLGAPSVASLGVPSPKVVPRGIWRKARGQGGLEDLGWFCQRSKEGVYPPCCVSLYGCLNAAATPVSDQGRGNNSETTSADKEFIHNRVHNTMFIIGADSMSGSRFGVRGPGTNLTELVACGASGVHGPGTNLTEVVACGVSGVHPY
ncbi:hypothetical protein Bbelb_351140 [Branchiostoma belcheri]|nr:hypothetical protein Bbelb_351140 [Branchiostoma belcheri]